jgi:DNA-binding NarL/FixJ family response regulator
MQREKNRSVRLVIADHEVLLRSGGRAQQSSASPAAAPEQESARPDPHHEHFTDVALVELATPLVNGIQLTSRLRSAAGQLKIIVSSSVSAPVFAREIIDAGADGYLLNTDPLAEVKRALERVMNGEKYVSSAISAEKRVKATCPLAELTPREREVLRLISEGNANKRIAVILGLSTRTIESYRSQIMHKLRVSHLAGLIKLAVVYGLTSLQ